MCYLYSLINNGISRISSGPYNYQKALYLKIHKAAGPDDLSARVFKECSSEIAPV